MELEQNINYPEKYPIENIEWKLRDKKTTFIKVNVDKLLEILKNDSPDFYVERGGKNEIGNRIDRFKEYFKKHIERVEENDSRIDPIELPMYNFYNNKLGVTDGRHRTVALKELGYKEIFIEVPKEQVSQFEIMRFEKGGSVLLNENFKKWFNGSKVVDFNNEPLACYHASNTLFNIFDVNKQGNNYYGNGLYFSSDKKDVKQYGKKIITVFLSIKKPFILNNETKKLADKYANTNNAYEEDLEQFAKYTIGYRAEHPDLFQQNIKKDGYDGLIVDDGIYKTYIAYSPEQIKLADGKNKTFDVNNPDIRFDGGGGVDSDIEYLYHGTDEKSAKEILKNGFSIKQSGKKSGAGTDGISFSISKEEALGHAEWASNKFKNKGVIIRFKTPDDLKLMEGNKYFEFSNFKDGFEYAKKNKYDGIKMYDFETGEGAEELEVLIINLDKIKKQNLTSNINFVEKGGDIRFDDGGEIILELNGTRYVTKDGKAFADIEKHTDDWYVEFIESKSKGLGTSIMNRIIDDAKKSGVNKIKLTAINSSVDFFKKLGFEVTLYSDNDNQMELMLSPDIRFCNGGEINFEHHEDLELYNNFIKPKLDNIGEVKEDEIITYSTGDSEWVDTDLKQAVTRPCNETTKVMVYKKSDLIEVSEEHTLMGIYKINITPDNFAKGGEIPKLKKSIFSSMPINYKIGVVIRAYEVNEDVEWSITEKNIDWLNDKETIDTLISDYNKHYPDREFSYGLVPTDYLIKKVSASDVVEDYDNFYQYHRVYSSTNPAKHKDANIPILVNDDEDEFIEDGWHRFHRYIDLGVKEIPVVSYNPDMILAKGGAILLNENFKKWFEGSKVVDKKGEPLIMWHGGSFNSSQGVFRGVGWFTSIKSGAKHYAKTNFGSLTTVYLSVKNPYYSGHVGKGKYIETNQAVIDAQRKGKYDGVIDLDKNGDIIDVVVFDSKNIKLADGSNKTFDGNNPDIRFGGGGGVFTSYDDAIKWMEEQSKKYKSKGAFYGSDEYKQAYPVIQKLYKEEKDIFGKKGQEIMLGEGLNFGDSVFYDSISPFGLSENYSGIIVNRDGVPYIKLVEGQKTMSGKKSLIWNKAWKKINLKNDGSNPDIRFDKGGAIPKPKYESGQVLYLKGYGKVKILDLAWLTPPMTVRPQYIYDFILDYEVKITKRKRNDFSLYEYEVDMMLADYDTGIDYKSSYEKYVNSGLRATGNPPLKYNSFIKIINGSLYYKNHPELELNPPVKNFYDAYAVKNIKILYLHGIGATPESDNVSILKRDDVAIISPYFDYEKGYVFDFISKEIIEKQGIRAVVGHSLGGYLAYYLSNKYKIPCLMFNPAFDSLHPIPNDVKELPPYYEQTAIVGSEDEDVPTKNQLEFLEKTKAKIIIEKIDHDIPNDIKVKYFNEFINGITGNNVVVVIENKNKETIDNTSDSIKDKRGKFELPENHEPFMKVHKGGSSCANCEYLGTENGKHICTNKYFVNWYGKSELPENIDEFCSDWYSPNEKLKHGGELGDSDKVFGAASRFKPHETIVFEPPIVGKSGAKLISYQWAYEFQEYFNKHSGDVATKRVSDWDKAIASADTGKNIVHQFEVQKTNGEFETVSSESVLVLLGFTDRKSIKSFPSLVNSVKTLAKQKMQLVLMEAQQKEYDELKNKFDKAQKPEIVEIEEPVEFVRSGMEENAHTVYSIGDVWYRQDNPYDYYSKTHKKIGHPTKQTIEQLTYDWIDKRIKENGGSRPNGLYDLKKRIERQERKVKQITEETSNETKFKKGGELGVGDYTNMLGEIQEETESQFKINGNWYHKSIVHSAPKLTDKKSGEFYNGIKIPKTVSTDLLVSAFENPIDWDKVEVYTVKMKADALSHEFPKVTGFPAIIDDSDVGGYFLNGNEITESDIGKQIWKVWDGHHRSIAAINAKLPYVEVELYRAAITNQDELKDGGNLNNPYAIYDDKKFVKKIEESIEKDGSSFICSYVASAIRMLEGKKVKIYGFSQKENPQALYFKDLDEDEEEGHHFAVADDRYIIDAWIFNNFHGKSIFGRSVFDLKNPNDKKIIEYIYGKKSNWTDITNRADDFEKLFSKTSDKLKQDYKIFSSDIKFDDGGGVDSDIEYLYQGTDEKSAREILKNGFSIKHSGKKSGAGTDGISFSISKEEALGHAEWASDKFKNKGVIIRYKTPDGLKLMDGKRYFEFDNWKKAFDYAKKNKYDGIKMYDFETGEGAEELEVLIINLDKIKKQDLTSNIKFIEKGGDRFDDGGSVDDDEDAMLELLKKNKEIRIQNEILKYKAIGAGGKTQEDLFIDKVINLIYEGTEFKSKLSIERVAEKEFGFTDKQKVRELTEYAILKVGRDIAGAFDVDSAYPKLVSLYSNQPYSTHKTNISVALGQFSTPLPMAYLMGVYVGINEKSDKVFFEPCGGSGNLTVAGTPEEFVVNELDKNRYNNLIKENYKEVLNQDANKPFPYEYNTFDGMVANPPFASTPEKLMADGFPISGLEQQIIIRSLNYIKPQAKTAFIIGGHTEFDAAGRLKGLKDKTFLQYLFSHYKVDDVINLNGSLYGRQGTTYPIRIVLIKNRKDTVGGYYPLANKELDNLTPFSVKPINDFNQLFERIGKSL